MSESTDIQALYRQTVLDHCRHPRNCRPIDTATRTGEGHNPLCGDHVKIYLKLEGDIVNDAAFEATGCAISLASASMLTEMIRGKPLAQVDALIGEVRAMFTPGSQPSAEILRSAIGALNGVRVYPSRIRCATLPWRALEAALHAEPSSVTTELE